MGIKSLAAGHTKLAIFATKPATTDAGMAAITVTAMTATGVLDAACRIAMSDFKLGATDDNTVSDPALCDVVASDVPTTAKYDGQITPFRYFDLETGVPDTSGAGQTGDQVFQALKVMGTTVWIARRDTSKLSTAPWVANDPYIIYECVTGTPQEVPQGGWIKNPIKLYVQRAWDGVVAAGA